MSLRLIQREYGGPEVLELVEVEQPRPAAGEVVVRARAAALNVVDVYARKYPYMDLTFPFSTGWDFAGTVEELGAGVDSLAVGDRVFGMPLFPDEVGIGQHVVGPAESWALTPSKLSDEEAAAVPLAALTVVQAFRAAGLKAGQRVLVHAAGGGVGHFAVQIARILGAEVVATASAEKADFVRSLGATEIIDYREHDFVQVLADRPVDVVLDMVGGDYGSRSAAVTVEGGTVLAIGYHSEEERALIESKGVRSIVITVAPDGKTLSEIASWIDDGRLRVEVSEVYPLEQAQKAHAALDSGRTRGKIVVTIS